MHTGSKSCALYIPKRKVIDGATNSKVFVSTLATKTKEITKVQDPNQGLFYCSRIHRLGSNHAEEN